jgi:hypothetical protein
MRFRAKLRNEKKEEVASRYFKFLTGHALTAPYLKEKLKKRDSDECWWCESGKLAADQGAPLQRVLALAAGDQGALACGWEGAGVEEDAVAVAVAVAVCFCFV